MFMMSVVATLLVLSAASNARDLFSVRMEISRNGEVISRPNMVLPLQQKGSITQTGEKSDIDVTLVIEEADATYVRIATTMSIDGVKALPSFVTPLDQEFTFQSNGISAKFLVSRKKT
jgi:hypothetical protein